MEQPRSPRRAWVWGLVALLALVAGGATAAAFAGRGTSRADARSAAAEVRQLERTRLHALVAADMPTLRRLHAADYQLITPDGSSLSRGEFLDELASGALDYLTFAPVSPIRVRVFAGAAVARYESTIDVVVAGVGRLTHNAWHTDLYEKRNGRWRIVWSQATPVGILPEPSPVPS
ncbi:MAG TPA: nuclear transport factor 2 family protein [Nocardioidaceae bacterium]